LRGRAPSRVPARRPLFLYSGVFAKLQDFACGQL